MSIFNSWYNSTDIFCVQRTEKFTFIMLLQFGARIHYRSSVYKVMALIRMHRTVQETLLLQLSVVSKFRGSYERRPLHF